MHGLINRSIQCFVHDTYGQPLWNDVAEQCGVGPDGFEAMLRYDDALTEAVLGAVSEKLDKPRDVLLEDMGTFLVSNPRLEAIRRLLRFGGETFLEFLHSLDDLSGRVRLAVPDLEVPDLELLDDGQHSFRLICRWHFPGAGHLLTGILRAMADDYGALVFLEYSGEQDGVETLQIELLDSEFAEGRSFKLSMRAG